MSEDKIIKELEEKFKCKICGERANIIGKIKFSKGKALTGGLLFGPVGLLAGTLHNKTKMICDKCGNMFEVDLRPLQNKLENASRKKRIEKNKDEYTEFKKNLNNIKKDVEKGKLSSQEAQAKIYDTTPEELKSRQNKNKKTLKVSVIFTTILLLSILFLSKEETSGISEASHRQKTSVFYFLDSSLDTETVDKLIESDHFNSYSIKTKSSNYKGDVYLVGTVILSSESSSQFILAHIGTPENVGLFQALDEDVSNITGLPYNGKLKDLKGNKEYKKLEKYLQEILIK